MTQQLRTPGRVAKEAGVADEIVGNRVEIVVTRRLCVHLQSAPKNIPMPGLMRIVLQPAGSGFGGEAAAGGFREQAPMRSDDGHRRGRRGRVFRVEPVENRSDAILITTRIQRS